MTRRYTAFVILNTPKVLFQWFEMFVCYSEIILFLTLEVAILPVDGSFEIWHHLILPMSGGSEIERA
jgi:hypothetical protein